MTLPASGAISFNNINVELGVAGTTQASLGQASYRTLAGVASGQISMSNFYGKSNEFAFTISSNQTNANLRTLAVNAGWNASSKVVATISGGVYVSSNSTGTPGLTVNGSFPNGVSLINNGFIIGMGGAGGSGQNTGGAPTANGVGAPGGLALSVSVAVTVTNNGTIGGGGGGGGPGGPRGLSVGKDAYIVGGGGGGGGRTGATNSAGGSGGPGPSGAGAAGSQGTSSSAGSGGLGAANPFGGRAGAGGAGGSWGASGTAGVTDNYPPNGGAGGAGGGAITGNSNITYLATGTRLGSIS